MWMLPTNKSLLYALGIGLTLASVYGAGYTHARRIYRGEIAQLQQRHTEQALAAEQAYSAKLAEISAEKQKWHDFAQQQSAKLAETSRQLDTQTTRIKQEIANAVKNDQSGGRCYSGLYLSDRRLIDLTKQPAGMWFADLTRLGVDLAEYTIDCQPGIARPDKYWEG